MGAFATMPDLRPRRVLRLVARQARDRPLSLEEASDHSIDRARRRLGLVLRRRDVPGATRWDRRRGLSCIPCRISAMRRLTALLLLVACHPRVAAPPLSVTGETVTFRSGELTLKGSLYRPQGSGPFPAVLYNHGSAPGMLS